MFFLCKFNIFEGFFFVGGRGRDGLEYSPASLPLTAQCKTKPQLVMNNMESGCIYLEGGTSMIILNGLDL